MGLEGRFKVVEGSNSALNDRRSPQLSEAATAIVVEAQRDDERPLYVVCGAGLTDLASAYLMEPSIAKRLVVIWIGGPEYPDLAPTMPEAEKYEYNQRIDPMSLQVVFNDSDLDLWQVPTFILSRSRTNVASTSAIAQRASKTFSGVMPSGAGSRKILRGIVIQRNPLAAAAPFGGASAFDGVG